jgi:hypothetical protein
MNMNATNPNKLPVLGDYAFIYWPTFEPMNVLAMSTDLQTEISRLSANPPADDISCERFCYIY